MEIDQDEQNNDVRRSTLKRNRISKPSDMAINSNFNNNSYGIQKTNTQYMKEVLEQEDRESMNSNESESTKDDHRLIYSNQELDKLYTSDGKSILTFSLKDIKPLKNETYKIWSPIGRPYKY